MGLISRSVGHGVAHNADVGRDPLKVDCHTNGGEVVEEVMNVETEGVVGLGGMVYYELEGCEGVREDGSCGGR